MDGPAILQYVSPPKTSRPALRVTSRTIGWLTLIAAVVAGGWYGLQWRRLIWEDTRTIRFQYDIRNGYNLGTSVVEMTQIPPGQPVPFGTYFKAYLDSYKTAIDRARARSLLGAQQNDYQLDYAPGRLLIMSMWVRHLREQKILDWNPAYETTAPLLRVNTVASIITAVAMGLLVRHWRRARQRWPVVPNWRHPWREWPAVAAMLAVWLNPALIWNTHAWPQWDCWLLPFFVLGVLMASKQQWLAAGFLVAAGAIFKGQVIIVAPVLILWPLLAGKPMAALRFLIGVALLAAMVSLLWIAREPMARVYLAGVLMAIAAGVAVLGVRRKFDLVGIIASSIAALLVIMVLLQSRTWTTAAWVLPLAALVAVLPRWTPRNFLPSLIAVAVTGAIFLAGYAWGERYDWFEVAYRYPTDRRKEMSIGAITNLPAMLSAWPFHWRLPQAVLDPIGRTWWTPAVRQILALAAVVLAAVLIALVRLGRRNLARGGLLWTFRLLPLIVIASIYPWGWPLPMRQFLVFVFAITLLLCSVGAAVHERRRSPRVLIALFAPWVLMFAIMPQMHERYLLWGATLMSVGFGLSTGLGLLSLVVSFLAWVNMAGSMLNKDSNWMLFGHVDHLHQTVTGMMPGAAWAVLMAAAVYLYLAVAPEQLATDGAQMDTDRLQPIADT